MDRLLILAGLTGFVGLTLIFSELRWFRRPGLADRLAPYAPGAGRSQSPGVFSVESFRDVIAPLSQMAGERLAHAFGVSEELSVRLRRIHSPLDVATFRIRQVGWSGGALLVGALLSLALSLPPPLAALTTIGAPILTFLLLEQQIASASAAWQQRLLLELPVVAEQLGMLTAAGWSLNAALHRIATRGSGNCAADLRRVTRRIRHGLSETDALREWGDLADLDALNRLIAVLALNREGADLGRLIGEEARSIRRETQRRLIEAIERRNQQVWIPVTVAALIPGVLLMGVPFIDALALFSTT